MICPVHDGAVWASALPAECSCRQPRTARAERWAYVLSHPRFFSAQSVDGAPAYPGERPRVTLTGQHDGDRYVTLEADTIAEALDKAADLLLGPALGGDR